MKVRDLFEAKGGVEIWPVSNMLGHVKKFKKIDGWWEHPVEVKKWMQSHEIPQSRADKAEERGRQKEWDDVDKEERKKERALAANARRLKKENASREQIWHKVEEAVGNSFPDGDPIDTLGPWMRKFDISMDEVNAAVAWATGNTRRKNAKQFGLYDYLANMWDDYAADALHDAQQGSHGEDYSHEWFARPNPWKSS